PGGIGAGGARMGRAQADRTPTRRGGAKLQARVAVRWSSSGPSILRLITRGGERDVGHYAVDEERPDRSGEVEVRVGGKRLGRRRLEAAALDERAPEGERRDIKRPEHRVAVDAPDLEHRARYTEVHHAVRIRALLVGPPDAVNGPGRGQQAVRGIEAEHELRVGLLRDRL